MRKLILAATFLVCGLSLSEARFNEQTDQIGKSSFTTHGLTNVQLSTTASFVRGITFSGAAPSTVTIYNTRLFTNQVTTRTRVYWPGGQIAPTTVKVGVINSSGTMIHKVGNADTTFDWDWYSGRPHPFALHGDN